MSEYERGRKQGHADELARWHEIIRIASHRLVALGQPDTALDIILNLAPTIESGSSVIATALAEAERAQMERDCAAVCGWCQIEGLLPPQKKAGIWRHNGGVHNRPCLATPIRDAFAAMHPEPEGKEK